MGGPTSKDDNAAATRQRRRHDTIVSDSPLFATLSEGGLENRYPDDAFKTMADECLPAGLDTLVGDSAVAAAIQAAIAAADAGDARPARARVYQDTIATPDLSSLGLPPLPVLALPLPAVSPPLPPEAPGAKQLPRPIPAPLRSETTIARPPSNVQVSSPSMKPLSTRSRGPKKSLKSKIKAAASQPAAAQPEAPSREAAPVKKVKEALRNCPECSRTFPASVNFCPRDGALLPPSAIEAQDRVGMVIADRIQLADQVGKGAIGVVYRAKHKGMGREVAVKLMHPVVSEDAKAATRFLQEARLSSCLNHENVVEVHEYGRTDRNQLYIVMELLEGRTLRQIVKEAGFLPPKRAVQLIAQVCFGLQHAHDLGLVHRDMKPANVIVAYDHLAGAEKVKVLDFGIAVDITAMDRVATGTLCGTPAYLSPEQARGRPTDARSDIYAVGVMMFELLTGRPPFYDGTVAEIAVAHARSEPPRMAEVNGKANVPRALEAVVMRALSKEPGRRPATAKQLANSLLAAVGEKPRAADQPLSDESELGLPLEIDIPSSEQLGGPVPAVAAPQPRVEVKPTRGRGVAHQRNEAPRPLRRSEQPVPKVDEAMHPDEVEARLLLGLAVDEEIDVQVVTQRKLVTREPDPGTYAPELRSVAEKKDRAEAAERNGGERKREPKPRARVEDPAASRRRYRPGHRPRYEVPQDKRTVQAPAKHRPFEDEPPASLGGGKQSARGCARPIVFQGPLSRPGGVRAVDRRVSGRTRLKQVAQKLVPVLIAVGSFAAVVMSGSKDTQAATEVSEPAAVQAPAAKGAINPGLLPAQGKERQSPQPEAVAPRPPSNLAPAAMPGDRTGLTPRRAAEMVRKVELERARSWLGGGVDPPSLREGMAAPAPAD